MVTPETIGVLCGFHNRPCWTTDLLQGPETLFFSGLTDCEGLAL